MYDKDYILVDETMDGGMKVTRQDVIDKGRIDVLPVYDPCVVSYRDVGDGIVRIILEDSYLRLPEDDDYGLEYYPYDNDD